MKLVTRQALLATITLSMVVFAAVPASADTPACLKDSSESCYSGPVNLTEFASAEHNETGCGDESRA